MTSFRAAAALALLPLLLLLQSAAPAGASTLQEYQSFFSSMQGLDLPSSQASALAQSETSTLQQCGVNVRDLQALRDKMVNSFGGLDMDKAQMRKTLLPLAYHHVSSQKLLDLYKALVSWTDGGLSLPKSEGQSRAVELALRKADPQTVKKIYKGLNSYSNVPSKTAKATAMEMGAAGADPAAFLDAFAMARNRGKPVEVCIEEAGQAGAASAFGGLVRRYAKDGVLYTAQEFQKYYGTRWLAEWLPAPLEQRVARDRKAYTAAEYAEYFGASWQQEWRSNGVATQVRIAQDKKQYTLPEFVTFYKDDWQQKWAAAAELNCRECVPYGAVMLAKQAEAAPSAKELPAALMSKEALLAQVLKATPQEYEDWFKNPNGLGLGASDAAALARSEATTLQDCGVTVPALQAMRNALYGRTSLDLSLEDMRKKLLPLVYQHASPEKLEALFQTLGGSSATGSGMALPKAEAQSRAVELAMRHVEPEQLRALYEVLFGAFGLQLDQRTAQATALEQALAGADAATFKSTFLDAKRRGASQADCIAQASQAAVRANLNGLVRRYAKDAVAYMAEEFQKHYGAQWFAEWLAAPLEQRVAKDLKAYTAAEFAQYYGGSWAQLWAGSKEATQVRIAQDKKQYTMREFKDYYHDGWQQLWATAPETRCRECGPYQAAAAKAAATLVV